MSAKVYKSNRYVVQLMHQQFFSFLKRNLTQDPFGINRIFVSLYVIYNNVVQYNDYISEYVISKTDKDYNELIKVMSFLREHNVNNIDLEDMIKLFEYVVSPSERVVTGAIYTPKRIRNYITEHCLENHNDIYRLRIADISCGCGGFLMDIAKTIHNTAKKSYYDIFRENIFGIDIQSYSVERCKILLNLLAIADDEITDFEYNLLCTDTLDFYTDKWNTDYDKFDIIVGNPPYVCGRNIEADIKNKTTFYKVCDSGSTDLYIPFFQIAIEMLKDGGTMGYITMNSFLKSLNARKLREYFMNNRYDISIIDFRGHQVFKGKSTYTCLFFLEKKQSDVLQYCCDEKVRLNKHINFEGIPFDILDAVKGWNLNENESSNRVESVGIPLFKYCQTRHGIATLSNKTYIFSPVKEDELFYYLKKDNVVYPIEKEICRNIVNSNKLNSDISIADIVRKVIFPYQINGDGKAVIYNESYLKDNYPYAYSYLDSQRERLNSRDKGKVDKYASWYAYGRTQSLVMPSIKLFFPKIANKPLSCIIVNDENLLLYNGMAFVGYDMQKMRILQRILESDIFWKYVTANSKPYTSGYYSLNGANIKNFGIPIFSSEEEQELLGLQSKKEVNNWLTSYYD